MSWLKLYSGFRRNRVYLKMLPTSSMRYIFKFAIIDINRSFSIILIDLHWLKTLKLHVKFHLPYNVLILFLYCSYCCKCYPYNDSSFCWARVEIGYLFLFLFFVKLKSMFNLNKIINILSYCFLRFFYLC
jgi:hypothetical protein